jgi:hypothetical protein
VIEGDEDHWMQSETSHLERTKLRELRPTQLTVGMAEVKAKQDKWKLLSKKAQQRFLSEHWFPGVMGPSDTPYIVDHHHLALALWQCSVKHVRLVILADLAALEEEEFWMVMDHRDWVHPYDANGQRVPFATIPKKITGLLDDPYRSLAEQVRLKGGYAKSDIPFAEFLWADFFRRRIALGKRDAITQSVRSEALALAATPTAKHLPGWSGTERNSA